MMMMTSFVLFTKVTSSEALTAKLDNAFILICLNRFQQIVAVHTFQAESEQLKVPVAGLNQFKPVLHLSIGSFTLLHLTYGSAEDSCIYAETQKFSCLWVGTVHCRKHRPMRLV